MGHCVSTPAVTGSKTIVRDYNLTRHEQTRIDFPNVCDMFDIGYSLLPRTEEYASIFHWKPTDTIIRLVVKFQDGPGSRVQATDHYLLCRSESDSRAEQNNFNLSVHIAHDYIGPEQTMIDSIVWFGLSFDCQTFLTLENIVIPKLCHLMDHTLTVLVDFNLTQFDYQCRESVLDAFSQQPFCMCFDPLQSLGQVIAPPKRFWPSHWHDGTDWIVRYICMPRMSRLVYSCCILSQPRASATPDETLLDMPEHNIIQLHDRQLLVQPHGQSGLFLVFLNHQLVGLKNNNQTFIPSRFLGQ